MFSLRADLDIVVKESDHPRRIVAHAEGEDRQIGSEIRVQLGLGLEPQDGGTLDRADEVVVLRYSEGIQPRFSDFALHFLGDDDEAALTHDTRLPRIAPEVADRNRVVSVPLPDDAADGWYALDWEVLAEDGHTTSGTLRFRLAR